MEYTLHILIPFHVLDIIGIGVSWGKDCGGRCGEENHGKTVGIEDHVLYLKRCRQMKIRQWVVVSINNKTISSVYYDTWLHSTEEMTCHFMMPPLEIQSYQTPHAYSYEISSLRDPKLPE